MKLSGKRFWLGLPVAAVLLSVAGCHTETGADKGRTPIDPCRLEFKRLATCRSVLDNELPLAVYDPLRQIADVQHPPAAFDRDLVLVSGWCPCAHYSADVRSVVAGKAMRMVFATVEGNCRISIDFRPGAVISAEGATARPTAARVPQPPFRCSITASGNKADVLVAKDGNTVYLGSVRFADSFDWRSRESFLVGKFYVERNSAEVVRAASSLSMGFGQADVRFVTTGRSRKKLYFEDGRVFFTFSPRGIGALGVASFDPSRFDVRLEGSVLFDAGDGLLRGDGPADLFYDEVAGEWRAWVCNFSTVSGKDGLLSGRAKGGVNYAWSTRSPLHGLSVMRERSLGLDGMNEDPTGFFDETCGKWRIFLSEFAADHAIRGSLWESDAWNGPYARVTPPTKEDSTGQCLVCLGDSRWWALAGSADQACHVYEYPSLRLHGDIRFDIPPWNEKCPNGRVWATLAELPEGYPHRFVFLTMDRANFPGVPNPNWTYGALYYYGAN